MGSSVGSIHIYTQDLEAVCSVLSEIAEDDGIRFFVSPPHGGWIGVYPDDQEQHETTADQIAQELKAPVFHVLVDDDGVFRYRFFRGAELADYHSSHGPVVIGRPNVFRELFPTAEALGESEKLLSAEADQFASESERLEKFA